MKSVFDASAVRADAGKEEVKPRNCDRVNYHTDTGIMIDHD
jgi:hypothetical protein